MGKLKIEPSSYIWAAILLYLLPLKWLLCAAAAAVFHELCHLLVLKLLDCRITEIRVGFCGAAIRTGHLTPWEELICAAAGPAGSILLVSMYRLAPELSLCALLQGIFNLLPVYPLDGGRMVRCMIYCFCKRPEQAIRIVESCILTVVFLLTLILSFVWQWGILPCVLLAVMAGKAVLRKIPCKPNEVALQ